MNRKKSLLLMVLAVAMVLSASINSAFAYFTTYTRAQGGYVIELDGEITIVEDEPTDWTKHVRIVSTAYTRPVYVRARAYAGAAFELTYSGTGWTYGGDGWYYYSEILYGGQETATLDIHIGNIPENIEVGESFNVIVVYEYTPVLYDANGNPYANWSN